MCIFYEFNLFYFVKKTNKKRKEEIKKYTQLNNNWYH